MNEAQDHASRWVTSGGLGIFALVEHVGPLVERVGVSIITAVLATVSQKVVAHLWDKWRNKGN